jgi:hypothetical protein
MIDKLDEKTVKWLRELVQEFGGDRERAALWLARLPGSRFTRRLAREWIAEALGGSRENPSLWEEIDALNKSIRERQEKMDALLARVEKFRGDEKNRERVTKGLPEERRKRDSMARAIRKERRRSRRGNPSIGRDAVEKFKEFTGRDAGTVHVLDVPDVPNDVIILGELASVGYVTSKEYDGGKRTEYVHRFGRPRPKLLTDPKGKELFIAGGKFKVNDRGLVG